MFSISPKFYTRRAASFQCVSQLEEARQIHSRFEKEFSCKSEETAQLVRKHQELLEQLEAESTAKARLALELHKAEGECGPEGLAAEPQRARGWAGRVQCPS